MADSSPTDANESLPHAIIKKIPVWLIALSMAGFLILMILSFLAQKPLKFGKYEIGFSPPDKNSPDPPHRKDDVITDEWTGVFVEIKDNSDEEYCTSEKLNLDIRKDSGIITGTSKETLNTGQTSWIQVGYEQGNFRALAYKSNKVPIGIGTYLLNFKEKDIYIGHWEGNVLGKEKIAICPYVLSKDSEKAAFARWKEFLSTGCQYIDLMTNKVIDNPYHKDHKGCDGLIDKSKIPD